MASKTELARIAAAMNALRPEWARQSLLTYLQAKHADKAPRDLAVAAAWICCDEATATPARLGENGPWWTATRQLAPVMQLPRYRGEPPIELDPDNPTTYLNWLRAGKETR